jgi:hypothetical protein
MILFTCGTAHAADFPVNHALSDERLDTIRGGFNVGDLRVSLGLERTVLINGVEAIRQSVNIPDISQITTDQANALRSVLNTTVVNNGVGGITTTQSDASANAAQSSQAITLPSNLGTMTMPSGTAAGLVVQNSLDNQAITATTTIDASVNTAHMLQNIRVDEAIKDAVIQFRGN